MSRSVASVDYASATPSTCPLCHQRPLSKKKRIYGHLVCKKCCNAFANRRQLVYFADALVLTAVNVGSLVALRMIALHAALPGTAYIVLGYAINAVLLIAFAMKDGFSGQSLGKRMADVQTLLEATGIPAGFAASFKRYAFLLIGLIPYGYFLTAVLTLIMAVQVASGYRLFDRMAGTRVIWKRYADSPVFGGTALQCEQCGYNLAGNTSGICPECGTAVSARNQELLLETAAVPTTP